MTSSATVTAVIPTYNRARFVGRAIETILRQTRPVDEIVVVDDGSTDGTPELLRREYGDRLRVVVQKNQGVSGARRRGVAEAKSEWVAFLDSDDEWTPDRNRLLTGAAEQVPDDVAWVFGDSLIVSDGGKEQGLFDEHSFIVDGNVQVFDDPMPTQFPFQLSLLQSGLIRRSAILGVNGFGEGLRHSEDLLLGWQIAAKFKMAAIPQIVTRWYRVAELASSSADLAGRESPDYHRARVIGYAVLAKSGRPGAWGVLHSDSVRRLCLRNAEKGDGGLRRLAMKQFDHAVSGKAVLFMGAVMLGRPGLHAWKWMTTRRDRGLAGRSVQGVSRA